MGKNDISFKVEGNIRGDIFNKELQQKFVEFLSENNIDIDVEASFEINIDEDLEDFDEIPDIEDMFDSDDEDVICLNDLRDALKLYMSMSRELWDTEREMIEVEDAKKVIHKFIKSTCNI